MCAVSVSSIGAGEAGVGGYMSHEFLLHMARTLRMQASYSCVFVCVSVYALFF